MNFKSRISFRNVGIPETSVLLLFFLFLFPQESFSEFYKYVDKNGKIHFVDSKSKIPKEYRKDLKTYEEKYDHLSEEEREKRIAEDRKKAEEFRKNREELKRKQENVWEEKKRRERIAEEEAERKEREAQRKREEAERAWTHCESCGRAYRDDEDSRVDCPSCGAPRGDKPAWLE